jgi:hypothetical protein
MRKNLRFASACQHFLSFAELRIVVARWVRPRDIKVLEPAEWKVKARIAAAMLVTIIIAFVRPFLMIPTLPISPLSLGLFRSHRTRNDARPTRWWWHRNVPV